MNNSQEVLNALQIIDEFSERLLLGNKSLPEFCSGVQAIKSRVFELICKVERDELLPRVDYSINEKIKKERSGNLQ